MIATWGWRSGAEPSSALVNTQELFSDLFFVFLATGVEESGHVVTVLFFLDEEGVVFGCIARFFAEILSIQRLTGAALRVIACDCAVHAAFDVRPGRPFDPQRLGVGGGGTDFAPGIAAAVATRPDIVVYLTDLQGPTGPDPRLPVVWAVPSTPGARAPVPAFGSVVRLR